jgi:IclR family KDG regulon transcriptional repressor
MLSTVLHALDVLEFLAERSESGVSEISKNLGLAPSTTHRLISSLASRGFLVQNPATKKYKLGVKIFQIGSSVVNRFGFRQAALVNMEKLAAESNETVNLGILDNDKVIYIEKILNDDPIRVELQIGHTVPAQCTGMGKAILAFLAPDKLESLLRNIRYEKRTGNSITGEERLRGELVKIREQGYALDDGELIEGIRCVAAPVFNKSGSVVAAVSIAGPSFRLTDNRIRELIPLVKTAADNTTKHLEFSAFAI